jgi:ubiquinone/menaquinone biosynthesis C-methylase UbiE
MGKLAAIYTALASSLGMSCFSREQNANRPAWIRARFEGDAHFICYDGNDGERTYYELRFGSLYLPIDAAAGEIALAYNHIAEEYDALNPEAVVSAGLIRKKAGQYCQGTVEVLDIFAGTGIVAKEIADLCSGISLIDISESMIEVAKRRPELANANFHIADIRSFDFPQDYGLITCSHGLNYLNANDLESAVAKMQAAQGPGGLFVNVGRANTGIIKDYYQKIEEGIAVLGRPEREYRYFVGANRGV